MAIPSFDHRGFLPPYIGSDATTALRSPYRCAMEELVKALGITDHRRALLRGLLQYRAMLRSFDYLEGVQFIDGSFCENVEAREGREPGDIDVFSFLVRPAKYALDQNFWLAQGMREWADEIVNQSLNKSRYQIDSYGIADDQFNLMSVISVTTYWSSLFSHKKITHDWKGFIQIDLNDPTEAAASSLL